MTQSISGRSAARPPALSFSRSDIERGLGLPAGPFTQPGLVLPLLLAVALTAAVFAAALAARASWFGQSMLNRGWVPYGIAGFSCWALMIIFVKSRKIRLQRRALLHDVTPDDPGFVISTSNVHLLLDRLYEIAENPRQFLLYNRIQFALSNLKNMGRVGDVDEVLRSRAHNDEAAVESSYTIVRGLIWAIPVLGFIGTVLGLAQAIGSFGSVLSTSDDMAQLKPALSSVTAGLSTAFETTLQALVAALVIQLLMTMVRRSEEQMLDQFNDYTDRQIVSRLRVTGQPDAKE